MFILYRLFLKYSNICKSIIKNIYIFFFRRSPYDILHVKNTDDIQYIRTVYNKLLLKYHPDRKGSVSKTQEIMYAYNDILEDIGIETAFKSKMETIKNKIKCYFLRDNLNNNSLNRNRNKNNLHTNNLNNLNNNLHNLSENKINDILTRIEYKLNLKCSEDNIARIKNIKKIEINDISYKEQVNDILKIIYNQEIKNIIHIPNIKEEIIKKKQTRKYWCKECKRSFNNENKLIKHQKYDKLEGKCASKSEIKKSKETIKRVEDKDIKIISKQENKIEKVEEKEVEEKIKHRNIPNEPYIFLTCSYCNKEFKDRNKLYLHIKERHINV
ncbi:DnaJ-like protein [Spraguea lophii 42_110]|uniref:DnaJ-like protein n=1 Tax=Spraguea lophii (strain 42_110) TaxID=1358809 RepID=S7WB05_SPRLO|nr:DnaJ-like protein [Spraguea lophii 42_110]